MLAPDFFVVVSLATLWNVFFTPPFAFNHDRRDMQARIFELLVDAFLVTILIIEDQNFHCWSCLFFVSCCNGGFALLFLSLLVSSAAMDTDPYHAHLVWRTEINEAAFLLHLWCYLLFLLLCPHLLWHVMMP